MNLGKTMKDKITGFKGVVVAHCEYLTGCNQTLLVPPVDDKGAKVESQWFDDQRLEALEAPVVTLDNGETPGCDIPAPIK